jgi:nitrite reductase/ring-hydroxylating ferredoxin subunit
VCDAAETLTGSDAAANAADAALAIGVAGALPAAATGLNDWSYLRGDSKRIGTIHAIVNTTGLLLNVGSLLLRRTGQRDAARMLSFAAYGGALVSAHLGGLLSFGLGVRVNRTAFESPEHEWQAVLDESALDGSAMVRVEFDGEPALVTRAADGRVCAIAATCTHLGGPLDEGDRDGDVVTCPWHASKFDLCTGAVVAGPAVFPQPVYESRVVDGRIELRPQPNT